jgi:hypothetical protein
MIKNRRITVISNIFLSLFSLCLFCLFFHVAILRAQQQTTFTAYYPTTGAWRTVRVLPSATCSFGSSCGAQGQLCYSTTSQALLFCGSTGTWQSTGRWTRNGNNVYYMNDVTIGMEGGEGRQFSVLGSSNLCVRRYFSSSSGTTWCPAGFNIATTAGTAAAYPGYSNVSVWGMMGVDYYMCCRTCARPDTNRNGICDE